MNDEFSKQLRAMTEAIEQVNQNVGPAFDKALTAFHERIDAGEFSEVVTGECNV